MAFILAGVGNIQLYNSSTGDLILTSKTLTESGIEVGLSAEDIRAGLAAGLIGKYFHSSSFDLNLVDALFSLEYLSLNVGGQIIVGGNAITEEQVITSVPNSITVTGTPVVWGNLSDIPGWYTIAGQNDWKRITFTGKTANVSDLAQGTKICVRYNASNDALREFTVPSAIIPSEMYAILEAPLFAADQKSFTTSSQVGKLVIEIPRFILNGAQSFSMSMTGAATSNLAGSALVSFTGNENCNAGGYYAKIKEIVFNKDWTQDLEAMAVNGAEITMKVGDTKTLDVIGLYQGGATGKINNANLTFTSATPATATVGANTGVIEAKQNGTTVIGIYATNKNTVDCYAQVTVQGV